MLNSICLLGKRAIWIIPAAFLSKTVLLIWGLLSRKVVSVYEIPDRFGHQLIEPDIYFSQFAEKRNKYRHLAVRPKAIVSKSLINMWEREFEKFPQMFLRSLNAYEVFSGKMKMTHRVNTSPNGNLHLLNDKPIYVSFSKDLPRNAEVQALSDSINKPIVFLTLRDIKYDQKIGIHTHGMHARYRNSTIDNYGSAIKFLIKSGYFVVRGGEVGEESKLNTSRDFLDLTENKFDLIRDELQFMLASKAEFFIGSDTGAIHLATLFRKPFFRLNIASFQFGRGSIYEKLTLLKNFVDLETNTKLDFEEIILRGVMNFTHDEDYSRQNIKVIENSPEEILEFAKECAQYYEGNWKPNKSSIWLSDYFDEICTKYGYVEQRMRFSNRWASQYAKDKNV